MERLGKTLANAALYMLGSASMLGAAECCTLVLAARGGWENRGSSPW